MKRRCVTLLLVVVVLSSVYAVADDIALTLNPLSGDIAGPAGSTIGWGYTITNNTALWIQPTAVSSDAFLNETPNLVFDFPAVAPGTFVTLDFSLVANLFRAAPPCGLYSVTWDTTATVGFVDPGTFIVSSDFYDGDPNNGGNDLGPAPDASAVYSATVTGSGVPEPSSLILMASGLVGLGMRFRHRL